MSYFKYAAMGLVAIILAATVSASGLSADLLQNIKEQSSLINLIAYSVIIVLLILIIFHLHSIDTHLNWIRRIK